MSTQLFFHAPCFDGLASAALATAWLEPDLGPLALQPIGYDRRDAWLDEPPPGPFAVVDFAYHPAAVAWVDHHPTAFARAGFAEDYAARRVAGERVLYDPAAPACATVLWGLLPGSRRTALLERLADAARRTDSVAYESPEEAVFGQAPEYRLTRALGADLPAARLVELALVVAVEPLEVVAALPWVQARVVEADRRAAAEVARIRDTARCESGIVSYRTSGDTVLPSRYAPYVVFPEAEYVVAVAEGPLGAKVTANRNPWRSGHGPSLGAMMARWGGGGHQGVGSILLRGARRREAEWIAATVISELTGRPAE